MGWGWAGNVAPARFGVLGYFLGALVKLPVAIASKPFLVANQGLTHLWPLGAYMGVAMGCGLPLKHLSRPIAVTILFTLNPAMAVFGLAWVATIFLCNAATLIKLAGTVLCILCRCWANFAGVYPRFAWRAHKLPCPLAMLLGLVITLPHVLHVTGAGVAGVAFFGVAIIFCTAFLGVICTQA